ncbi:nuclear transport factor 2 family protein [Geodermatophilus sp. URMC 63]
MTASTDLADCYLAAWNETDTAARRALLDQVFTEDVTYTDPLADVAGRDGLDAAIAAVQAQFPGWGDGRIRTVLGFLDRVPAAP